MCTFINVHTRVRSCATCDSAKISVPPVDVLPSASNAPISKIPVIISIKPNAQGAESKKVKDNGRSTIALVRVREFDWGRAVTLFCVLACRWEHHVDSGLPVNIELVCMVITCSRFNYQFSSSKAMRKHNELHQVPADASLLHCFDPLCYAIKFSSSASRRWHELRVHKRSPKRLPAGVDGASLTDVCMVMFCLLAHPYPRWHCSNYFACASLTIYYDCTRENCWSPIHTLISTPPSFARHYSDLPSPHSTVFIGRKRIRARLSRFSSFARICGRS